MVRISPSRETSRVLSCKIEVRQHRIPTQITDATLTIGCIRKFQQRLRRPLIVKDSPPLKRATEFQEMPLGRRRLRWPSRRITLFPRAMDGCTHTTDGWQDVWLWHEACSPSREMLAASLASWRGSHFPCRTYAPCPCSAPSGGRGKPPCPNGPAAQPFPPASGHPV